MLLALLSVSGLDAQTLTVSYVDGHVQLQTASGLSTLSIGDSVPREGTLRVADASYVELAGQGLTIVCSQPGAYSVQALLSASKSIGATGAAHAISTLFSKLVSGPLKAQNAALGARGANQSKDTQTGWVTSDSEAYLQSGKDLIRLEKYPEAIQELQEALEAASDQERPEVRYYLASAHSLRGDVRSSFQQISKVTCSGGEPWAADYVLLKARILIDTSAFQQAISLLTEQGGELPQDAQRAPLYHFLLALSYQGVGDVADERENLARVVRIAAGTNIADVAKEMLGGL
jgi:tetratricopeptide (TPR) repeat protein